ncbi:uncharacterized protein LOC144141207 [Haemaphysalis longicornis]
MQVSRYNSLFAKKTSNYYLVQLPSPQCLCEIILECAHTTSSLLLLLSGDVETNPGPEMQEILTELQRISAGQATLLTEVQELKNQLSTTNQTITDLSKRMTEVENHYQNLSPLQADLEVIRTYTTETNRLVSELKAKLDDAETRSRRNNLIFYNLPDPNPAETNAESEGLIIRHCLEHLQVAIDPKEIDRAHRLGRHAANRHRPIIAKFTFHKTKETVLTNAPKLKETDFSIGEDFSQSVRTARRHLVNFAKTKSTKFQIRYKTLHMGSKRYIFDNASQTVKEIA